MTETARPRPRWPTVAVPIGLVVLALLAGAAALGLFLQARVRPRLPREVAAVLAGADTFELLSLRPGPIERHRPDTFYGWVVLGRAAVPGDTRAEVLAATNEGIAHGRGMSLCFEPRHGIHAVRQGHTADLVICFHCHQTQVYLDGRELDTLPMTDAPRELLDRTLNRTGVWLGMD